ncbi:rRNA-processing protein EBP2 [Malassezia caprae]|uniref:rRNA-processing protein EBP2 n=1 Tax=Malassezia caprae TaxID=1381934 RepID=A0AAF0EF02_9BASI|nr:rRNA-processing protein EBP2 [Malassezia caprae]
MGRSDVRRGKSARAAAEQATPLKKSQNKQNKASHIVNDLDDEEALHEGEDEAGISQKGIERMMRALGEDGLSEMDLALLEQLRADRVDEEDEDEDEDEAEDEDLDDDDAEEAEDDEDEDLDDDDAEEAEDDEDEDLIDDEAEEAEDDEDEEVDEDEAEEAEDNDDEEAEDNEEEEEPSHAAPKDSLAASILRSGLVPDEDDDEEEEEDEDDEDEGEDEDAEPIEIEAVPSGAQLSEQELASRHHRIRINHTDALERVYEDFRLDAPSAHGKMPWIETMSLDYDKVLADEVPDVQNDLDRELAFYRQALAAAVQGRQRVLEAGVPFSRPSDYFAEMLKTDEHMERVRQRLLDESASIKASEDAKRQRELKKYGKKVQTEKLLERQRSKKEMEDKVNALKRKRSSGFELDDDEFDVQLEEAIGERKAEARKPRGKMSRQSRDAKYGFGGKKRHQKSNTAESTDAWGGARRKPGPARGKAKKPQRPGKSKRAARR